MNATIDLTVRKCSRKIDASHLQEGIIVSMNHTSWMKHQSGYTRSRNQSLENPAALTHCNVVDRSRVVYYTKGAAMSERKPLLIIAPLGNNASISYKSLQISKSSSDIAKHHSIYPADHPDSNSDVSMVQQL